jgi:hemolysin activation/secretion protein
VKQADSEEFPSLCTVYASITNSSKQQPNKRDLKQKETNEQQQQQQQQRQQAQEPARKPHVSPFAAYQAIAEEADDTHGSGASALHVSAADRS